MTSNTFSTLLVLSAVLVGLSSPLVEAFQLPQQQQRPTCSTTRLHESCSNNDGRRNFLNRGAGAAMSVLIGGTFLEQPAEASYTAYTQRENDWKERSEKGEIKVSTARELRAQLREIAPMNGEGMFCPNGPSSAVTPLMENRCGERQALPSVYGRSDDAMGNSVPGFGGANGGARASASTLRAELNAQSYFRDN